MKVEFRAMAGMRPGRFPELLAPSEAALAVNVRLNDGSIEPLPGLSAAVTTLASAGTVRSLYRFGQLLSSETSWWFESINDADFVKGPIADDTEERTYHTGLLAYPGKTNAATATGAPPRPTTNYRMGIVRPGGTPGTPEIGSTFAPVCTVSGTGTGANVTVVYTTTYVSAWDEESAPSLSSNITTYTPGQTVTVTLPPAPTGNYLVNRVRLYRSNTGSNATQFQLLAEVAVGTANYADNTASSALGEVLGAATFTEPDDAMRGLTLLPNGGMMGFFENQLCFCEPNYPHAWPIRYRRSMAAPIVGLAALESTVLVFTTRGTYVLNGTEPANMVEATSSLPQTCVSKRSIRMWRSGVVFAAREGLYQFTTSGMSSLTEDIMAPEDWQEYAPATLLGLATPTEYVGFFNSPSRGTGGFVIRAEGGMTFTETDIYATAGFLEPNTGVLFVVTSGNAVKKWESGASATFTWRSGVHREANPTAMSAARVEAESYPVTFKMYADGVLRHTETVANPRIFRLPGGTRASKFQCEVSGTSRVSYFAYASSAGELGRQ